MSENPGVYIAMKSAVNLKCYANKSVKVDEQIVEECRRTISHLKGYSYPKLFVFMLSAGEIKVHI